MSDFTTIQVKKTTKQKLDHLKQHKRQGMAELVEKITNFIIRKKIEEQTKLKTENVS